MTRPMRVRRWGVHPKTVSKALVLFGRSDRLGRGYSPWLTRSRYESAAVWPYLPTPGVFKADLVRAGIEPVDELGRALVFHSLRSMLATLLAIRSVPEPVVAKVLRRRDIRTTRRHYIRPEMEQMREALSRVEGDLKDFLTKGGKSPLHRRLEACTLCVVLKKEPLA